MREISRVLCAAQAADTQVTNGSRKAIQCSAFAAQVIANAVSTAERVNGRPGHGSQ